MLLNFTIIVYLVYARRTCHNDKFCIMAYFVMLMIFVIATKIQVKALNFVILICLFVILTSLLPYL